MPRIKIKLSEGNQGVEVDIDDEALTFEELQKKGLLLITGLSTFFDSKDKTTTN